MSDSHWEKVKDVFQTALEKPSSAERERYLNEACGANEDLRAEVDALLASFDEADDFLDESPIGEVAETIIGKREILNAGQQIGRYRIERQLGAGGAGEVFLAFDVELERFVALKILSAEFSNNPDHIRRFMHEARAASALNHPNILTVYESGQIENLRFIAAEYVEGETLREHLRRKSLNLHEVFDIFSQTAVALNAAHAAGIVHRDIKPENIMLRTDGLVKVLDFGLAKLVDKNSAESQNLKKTEFKTTPGLVMGTVAYMSPEQARGLPTDERTDVWSLGVCLSESVFGVQPFAGDTISDQIAAILKSAPEPQAENSPPELRRIIEKCLEKKTENRYQTIRDLLLDVRNFQHEWDFSNGNGFSFAETPTISASAKPTGRNISTPSTVSSATYIVGGIKRHKFSAFAASAVTVAALGLILYLSVFSSFFSANPINSIAVLPFVKESGDEDGEYLSDGLSESLINKLSQLPQLKVATRSSAFQYKNKTAGVREIAGTLNVEALVSGRVVKRGDDLQISVELINAAENTQIWGEIYRGKMADAQKIQEEIAQTILQKLQIKPTNAEAGNFNSPITNNAQAYQLYLNGVYCRRQNGTDYLKKAVEYQKQAIALDPNFALAYAELGHSQYNLIAVGAVDPQTGTAPARQAIEKALSLDETLAEAHDVNASLKTLEFDWTGTEKEIRRALELNPNLASAHTGYALYLSANGRFDEALNEIRRAQQLDPLRIGLVGLEGSILYNARRYDEALAIFERDDPDKAATPFPYIVLARAFIAKKRYRDAVVELRDSLKIEETTAALIHLGRAHALAGERAEALKILQQLEKTDKYVSPAEFATLYAALGMRERAFEKLEQAFNQRDFGLSALKVEPEYDDLRDDPRFSDLLRRINL